MRQTFGIRNFIGGLAGAIAGAVSYPLPHTLLSISKLPSAVAGAARALWRENKIGPNLKALIYITSPVAIVAIPPLVAVGSTLVGMFHVSYQGSQKLARIPSTIRDDLKKVSEYINELLPKLWDYSPEALMPGEKPFDISPFKALRGLIGGVFSTLLGGVLMLCVGIWHIPFLFIRVIRLFFDFIKESGFFLGLLVLILGVVAIPLAIILAPIAAVVFTLGSGCYRGYSKGLVEAVSGAFSDSHKMHEALTEIER